jgi:hypothetical protein
VLDRPPAGRAELAHRVAEAVAGQRAGDRSV